MMLYSLMSCIILDFFTRLTTLFDVNEYLEIFPSCSYRTETNEEGKVAC